MIYRTDSLAGSSGWKGCPLVSVIMATYNDRPEYIRQSVESILNQTFSNLELLIIDDSDHEDTRSAIDSYSEDSRVFIYRAGCRLGFVPSLNKGLSLAKGMYIARMDGDDVASLDRFEKQVKYLASHPAADIVGGQIKVIDQKNRITGSRFYPLGGLKLTAFFCLRTPVAHPSVMFKRRIVDRGYRYDESLKKAEDIDLWIRLYNDGYKIENMPDILVSYRAESNFIQKRVTDKAQENYVLKIRRKNISIKRPFFSAASWILSYIRQMIPDSLKVWVYFQENRNE